MRILGLSTSGSHLKTYEALESYSLANKIQTEIEIVEPRGFYSWTTATIPYRGVARRMEISPQDCGLKIGRSLWLKDSSFRENIQLKKSFSQMRDRCLHIVEKFKPDVYVTSKEAGWIEFSLLQAAKMKSVPVVIIQEGPFVLDRSPSLSSFLRSAWYKILAGMDMPVVMGTSEASLFCVASSYYSELVKKNSGSRTIARLTGLPRYDNLNNFKHRPKGQILFISQPIVEHQIMGFHRFKSEFLKLVSALKRMESRGYQIFIRKHPSEVLFDSQLAPLLPKSFVIQGQDDDLFESFAGSDFVCSYFSSSLVEAMALGIPSFSWKIPPYTDWFERAGVATSRNEKSFASYIEDSQNCSRAKAKACAEMELGVFDGKASFRCIKALTQLLVGSA